MEGFYDLATPFYAADYTMDHLSLPANLRKNVSVTHYDSGHMVYLRQESRLQFKKDVDDLRESPSLKIMQLFVQGGASLDYNDPYFPQLHKMRHYNYEHMKSVQLNPQTLASYDAVVIATDHSSYDYESIVHSAKLVIDTRNATRRVVRHREKIVLC